MNYDNQLLASIHPALGHLSGVPLVVFFLVVSLTIVFMVGYAIKGSQVFRQLKKAVRELKAIQAAGAEPAPTDIGKYFEGEPLRHLWDVYAGTLHEVQKASSGERSLRKIHATVPAESIFTRDVLVDSRLFDDFTRHLPGVLTGLGIIGTFAGLLDGLKRFDPSTTTKAVEGLGPLMSGVQHAFVASGVAIGCAMLVVFISRLALAYLYRLVEQLTHGLDGLYETGVGEKYLGRLVSASERNEANTAQLKDALVEDLNKMMTNLVERQIAAHQAATHSLGEHIGNSISTAIAEPIKSMRDAMEVTARGNGEQVNMMLETLLTGFMAKLEDTFGTQMRGINEQMQRSMTSMATVQESLQSLLADIKKTNEHASEQMTGTLEEAMKKAADNQQLLTDQMREFVQDFRKLVTEEQNKSRQAMDEAVMKVLGEVGAAMGDMEKIRKDAAADEKVRNKELGEVTTGLVGGLTTQIEALLESMNEQVNKTQQNIDALGLVSLQAIDGMNQGALNMGTAAQRFETAGNMVSTVFVRSSSVTEKLIATAESLQAAASAVQRGFEQYDSTRRTVDAQVASLMGLIETAKKEAGVSQELIASMKASAETMKRAESDAREHLDRVNDALVKAFTDFGSALVSQVKASVAETDRHLAQGTGHLNGVVQELATAVQRMKRAT